MMELRQKCEWADMSSHCAMNTPSEKLFSDNGVYISACWIPYSYTRAYKVYFVSDTTGNEFGQFADLTTALTRARSMAEYSQENRRQFDL